MADVLRAWRAYRERMSEPARITPGEASPASTKTLLTARPQPALAGERLHLVVDVITATGITPSGMVSVRDGALTLGSAPLNDGHATLSVRLFSSGLHTLQAIYDGDEHCAGSDAVYALTVLEPASVAIAAHLADGCGDWLTLTARVHGRWDGPACTGSVIFECDGLPLGSEEIHDGQAAISRVLAPGPHSLTATFGGDERHAGVRSEPLEIHA